jgi:uncharacterized protein
MPTIDSARLWYPSHDPVHGFDHILRVYKIAENLAVAEDADLDIVLAAVLLHDAHGSETSAGEAGREDHHHGSAAFARKILGEEGWPEDRIAAVEHCIRTHRFRDQYEEPQTIEAKILFDADKLDAIGAIGVVRAIAYAAVNGQSMHSQPSEQFLQTGEKLPGEPHTPYHEFIFKLNKLKDRMYTQTARSLADGRHRFMAEFFEQLAVETRGER